ncbi:class 3 adenylate cyclase [Algoriphagus boseongensis]|uniref:Class 3 adenylate cyclase n=1 Tax=Algoriphagus boseongensis TaxID=1442587 RepID=A0A4R6T510_9BACT|nr:adenylate/guanylate cyclase domain-containing protein [Algoriphagus boseongensis]TDQ17044.1 class 3 adenylate cyclase [Algoriphagus boseongensis]
MSSLEEKLEQAQKEINYYKNRLKDLTTTCMSLEYRNSDLSKDVIQMAEGLKVIAELQNVDANSELDVLFDNLAESINVRLKMDVASILLPEVQGTLNFRLKYLKGFGTYNTEGVREKIIEVPSAFFESKNSVILNQDEPHDEFEKYLRDQLEIHHLIFSPIIHNREILGYFFAGRRPQLLQKGKGVLPYHLNILDAIGGVISTVQNQLERQAVLERLVEERTKELKEEKEISENLLLNILPYETTQELKAKGTVKAKDYNLVTVLFTDFKNFTQFSAGLSSKDLVEQIDFYYREIDQITSRLGIEKIKTIGDSYMCVAGLPVEREDHAVIAVRAALEIRDFVDQVKQERQKEGRPYFEIRIGLNSGPVVAGIVGIKKFAYDIWGDTVNVASRMESSGEAGKINISESTFQLVQEEFSCHYRGEIPAKNAGNIRMYFVEPKG